MFICYGQNRIYRGWFKMMRQFHGKGFVRPTCSKCSSMLKIGDQVDGHFPYYAEYNRCATCYIREQKEE